MTFYEVTLGSILKNAIKHINQEARVIGNGPNTLEVYGLYAPGLLNAVQ